MLSITLSQLAQSEECDYDKAYIAGLNTIASEVPDMEQHAPYQVIEHEDHWLVIGYSGPGYPKGLVPTTKINKHDCEVEEFYFSD